jgi:hypothetical protein
MVYWVEPIRGNRHLEPLHIQQWEEILGLLPHVLRRVLHAPEVHLLE